MIDANTEARELRWSEDLVGRLSYAQLAGAAGEDRSGVRPLIDYVDPGPLWWGFSWDTATTQSATRNRVDRDRAPTPPQPDPRCDPRNGVVVLLDEIDKAEPELPNGLLEALGARQFNVRGREEPVRATKPWPLVIVTTNEERVLPDAFLRRCLWHEMKLPDLDRLQAFLVERGKQHEKSARPEIIEEIARQTVQDRTTAIEKGLRPLPGEAEFLDFVRAAVDLDASKEDLGHMARFYLQKHRGLRP